MAYDDRDYFRDGYGDESALGRMPSWLRSFLLFFTKSFPIGTYFDVRVRVHVTFLILFAIELLIQGDPWWTLRWTFLLFISVLLHEFGHVMGCRSVGGHADKILMWPLGGLAFCAAPRQPWPEFVTVICGPLVNLALAVSSYLTLLVWFGADTPVSLNPFAMFRSYVGGLPGFLGDLYYVNYVLLLFNLLLVFYPFDGGRLVQVALWVKMGRRQSLRVATAVGMGGAVLIGIAGLILREFMLVLIAAFGFYACYHQRRMLNYELPDEQADLYEAATPGGGGGGYEFEGGGYGYAVEDDEPKPGPLTRWKNNRQRLKHERRLQKERDFEQQVDDILAKVARDGMQSLSAREKRVLREATEKKRG